MSDRIAAFINKVTAVADKVTSRKNLPKWMTKNLRLAGRPYSFKNHEAHLDIARDTHPHQAVKKCSQVGLTELSLRIAAAIAAISRSKIIYILPSARFSEKVSTDRFLPIIQDSPVLRAMVHPEAKSSSMRKLGTSTIYFQGASGTSQAISIPATDLIIDEENFCSAKILGQFNSRLRHNPKDGVTGLRGSKRRFSTPTLPKYGVSKHYDNSDQKSYTVKCHHCNHTQVPDYYFDYVIPNYSHDIGSFSAQDLKNKHYKVDEAYVKCQKCGKDLWEDLMNPDQRRWVAKYPDVIDLSGYAMSPIDVPFYNDVPSIFKQLEGYTTQDHRNFVLGLDYEDANNSFIESVFESSNKAPYVNLQQADKATLSNIRIGIDIGKTSHITVGQRVNEERIDVINITTISMRGSSTPLYALIQAYIDTYNPDILVLDAAPDFTTPQTLISENRYGSVFGCEYRRSTSKVFSNTDAREEVGVVKADRSGTLTDLMELHNTGKIRYPDKELCSEVEELKQHLSVTKKITIASELGDVVSFPKPDEPDHYCHSLNYMMIGDSMVESDELIGKGSGMAPCVTTLKVGGNMQEEDYSTSSLMTFSHDFFKR